MLKNSLTEHNDAKVILLIEDDAEDQILFQSVLSRIQNTLFSYKLICARDLDEAIGLSKTMDIDLVFCDLSLPGYTGIKTVQKLLPHIDAPLIVLTGNSDKEIAIEALHMGAQDYLIKGTVDDPNKLDRIIIYAIERYNLTSSLAEAQHIALLGSWKFSKDTNLMSWTEQLYKIYDLDIEKDAATLENFLKPLEPNDAIQLKKYLDESLQSGKTFEFIAQVMKSGDRQQYTQIRGWPILDKKKNILGLKGTVQDITQRKVLENLKDEFISTVSHELRTPLAIIKGAVLNMKDGLVGDLNEAQVKTVEMLYRNTTRLGCIIDNLLDISRLESKQLKPNFSRVAINDILRGLSENFENMAKEKNINIILDLEDEEIDIYADEDMIEQVVTNLVSNALRFTRDSIIIKTRIVNETVQISVVDDGQGIPFTALTSIFDKFVQIKRPQGGQGYKGTGLGLPICKEIIARHHGQIWAESNDGEGAEFHFFIPQYDDTFILNTKLEEAKIISSNSGSELAILYVFIKDKRDLSLVGKEKDEIFKKIEIRLKNFALRNEDLIHYSKDKNGIVLFIQSGKIGAVSLCGRIQKEIAKINFDHNSKQQPQIQIGISLYSKDATEMNVLIEKAKKNVSAYQTTHKILIVDDEESLSDVLALNLESKGFNVAKAINGYEGLEKIKTFKPSVILLDIIMPGIDGWEVCRRLRADPLTRDLPIVIFSAAVGFSDEYQGKGSELGAYAILPKHCGNDSLIETLASACQSGLDYSATEM